MKRLPKKLRRFLCRAVYLLPLLFAVLLLIYAALPHLWFIHEMELRETQSLFSLQANTWEECRTLLEGEIQGSSYAVYFSHVMRVVSVVFWVGIVLYLLLALLSAVCSTVAFSHPPTHRTSNRAKRVLHLFCSNRILYLVLNLAPLLWAFFPQIVLYAYLVFFGYRSTVHYFFLADWILALAACAISIAAFLLTLSMQSDERLDMFRIYKAKKDLPIKDKEEDTP